MSAIFRLPERALHQTTFANEADLERAIVQLQGDLFGPDRIYLDIKRKTGRKGGLRNIPDGYLLDLSGSNPRLYVVENELASHDHLRHIAAQVLEFSLSCKDDPFAVKNAIMEQLEREPEAMAQCRRYAEQYDLRGADHLIDRVVFDAPFSALVIIDEMPEHLEAVLTSQFQFSVEILVLTPFEDDNGNRSYLFDPFLADVNEGAAAAARKEGKQVSDTSDIDTIVVPARDAGFESVFLGENKWRAARIHPSMRSQIKYIAAYRVRPHSAITHMARVDSIDPWQDTGKYEIDFDGPAWKIGPIRLLSNGRVNAPQSIRYTTRERLEQAKTLDDVW